MDRRLVSSPLGEFVPVTGHDRRYDERYDHVAFMPHPLPDQVELGSATWTGLTNAQAAIARLDGAVSELPDPTLLVRPLIRREAVSTSALEGTYTGFGELLGAEASRKEQSGDLREVLNYVRATEHGVRRLDELPVCMRLLSEAHVLLLDGVRGDSWELGALRSTQNWIGDVDCRIAEAAFVPPPPEALNELLSSWENWIHRNDLPLLVRVAMGHYQFETIHPYTDGNGRLGRLLSLLQLIEGGLLRDHLMTISGFFEADKPAYTGHLQRVRETGQFDAWIRYFCRALEKSAIESLDRIRQAQEHARQAVSRLRSEGVRGTAIQIAEDLVGYPLLTVTDVEQRYQLTYQTSNQAVTRLVDLGVLEQISQGNYNRVFASRVILDVFRM
ncbi:MAG: Fic/DOC family N-terminal domain-containing protein [Nitriliruptoraceae bacterium]